MENKPQQEVYSNNQFVNEPVSYTQPIQQGNNLSNYAPQYNQSQPIEPNPHFQSNQHYNQNQPFQQDRHFFSQVPQNRERFNYNNQFGNYTQSHYNTPGQRNSQPKHFQSQYQY